MIGRVVRRVSMESKKKTTSKVDIKKILNKVGKFLKRLFILIKYQKLDMVK